LQVRTSGAKRNAKKWFLAEPRDRLQKDNPKIHDRCQKAQQMLEAFVSQIQNLMGTENITVLNGHGPKVSLLDFYDIYKNGKNRAFSEEQASDGSHQKLTLK
jgi:hypothetical protein